MKYSLGPRSTALRARGEFAIVATLTVLPEETIRVLALEPSRYSTRLSVDGPSQLNIEVTLFAELKTAEVPGRLCTMPGATRTFCALTAREGDPLRTKATSPHDPRGFVNSIGTQPRTEMRRSLDCYCGKGGSVLLIALAYRADYSVRY